VFSGITLSLDSTWIHTGPDTALLALGLWSTCRVVDARTPRVAAVGLALSLALSAAVGHAQDTAYHGLLVVTAGLAYAHARGVLRARALSLLVPLACGGLLAALPLVPVASILGDTERAAGYSREAFGAFGLTWPALAGLLVPVLAGHNGFDETGALYATHLGAWLLPALALVIANRARWTSGHTRPLVALVVTGALFLWLSLGANGGVYSLTWGIPVWSSMRGPFKLLLFAALPLVAAGALALETVARHVASTRTRALAVVSAFVGIALVLFALDPLDVAGRRCAVVACLAAGAVAMLALAFLDRVAAQVALAACSVVAAVCLVGLVHAPARIKPYLEDRAHLWSAADFGVDTAYRMMPLCDASEEGARMQELGLYHAATLDDVRSVTGHRFALTSSRLARVLPAEQSGVMPPALVEKLVRSRLLESYNVRYAIAPEDQPSARDLVERAGWSEVKRTPHARIYENPRALPRAWLASRVVPFDEASFARGLLDNAASADTAFVEGVTEGGALPPATITRLDVGPHELHVDVDAPRGAFLVIAESAFGEFEARVDGMAVPIRRTNALLMGVEVAAGARRVDVELVPRSLILGACLALAGALALALWLRRR
jgi:hypothetical protein